MTAAGRLLLALALPVTRLGAGPAVDPLAVCDARVVANPEDPESYRCYNRESRRHGNLWADAARRLERRLAAEPRNDWASLILAHVEASRGGSRAEDLYREAAAGFAAGSRRDGEVEALTGLANALARRGRLIEADEPLARASAIADAAGDPILVGRARIETARHLWRKGDDLARAHRLAKEAEARVFPDGPPHLRMLCLFVLGAISSDLDRHQESAALHRRELEIVLAQGDRFAEATTRANLAVALLNQLEAEGRPPTPEAVQHMRDALGAAVGSGNRAREASLRRELGDLLEGNAALEQYRMGLALARELGDAKGMGRCLRGLANALVKTDPATGFRLADEALDLARRNADRWDVLQAWHTRTHMRWEAGPREQAIADSLSTLDALERIRDLQPDGESRARLVAGSAAYYRLAGRLLRTAGDPPALADLERAFAVTERMRSRVLLEALDAAGATPASGSDPLQARRNAVLAQIAQVQRRLADHALSETARADLLRELEERERDEQAAREDLVRASPSFAALRPRAATLRETQAALDADQAILAFQVYERWHGPVDQGGSWLWLVTRDTARVFPLPERSRIASGVELFRGLVARRDGAEAPAAARLHAELVQPGIERLPPAVTRLVIVPDGPLHDLPFAALSDAAGTPLGERYEIAMAPSVTLWMRLRQQAWPESAAPVLAFADPDLALGASTTNDGPSRDGTAPRLGRLPHARREARLAVDRLGGRLLIGPEASEHAVKTQELRRYRLLHFATHALVSDQQPERSAIVLAPGAPQEDGLLQIREIVGLDLTGRVVVLSSCRSASGAVLAGEGVMGLARAMFQARARTVVGSLWPLRDDDAARVFAAFYQALGEGRTVGQALRSARRERIRVGDAAAAWAALVVLGDADTVVARPEDRGEATRGWGWAVMLLLAAALAVLTSFQLRASERQADG